MTHTIIGDYNAAQPFIFLPPDFAAAHPESWLAEMEPTKDGKLRLEILDPKGGKRARGRRYSIIRNKGSFRLSIPRWWLRERRAKAGDVVEITVQTPVVAVFELIVT